MERNVYVSFMFYAIFLSMVVKTWTMLRVEHGNIYLMISYSFISVMGLMLGICYKTHFFIKWGKLLTIILGSALVVANIAEFICFKNTC